MVGHDQPVEQPGERALARAVGADDADPPLGQVQVEIGEHDPVAVDVPDAAQFDAAGRVRNGGGRLPPEPHRSGDRPLRSLDHRVAAAHLDGDRRGEDRLDPVADEERQRPGHDRGLGREVRDHGQHRGRRSRR